MQTPLPPLPFSFTYPSLLGRLRRRRRRRFSDEAVLACGTTTDRRLCTATTCDSPKPAELVVSVEWCVGPPAEGPADGPAVTRDAAFGPPLVPPPAVAAAFDEEDRKVRP